MAAFRTKNGSIVLVDDGDVFLLALWSWSVDRYVHSYDNGKTIYLHRVITRAPLGVDVDHINGDRLDNRRHNLRLTTRQGNSFNRHRINNNNTSGITGVSFISSTQKWRAEIWVGGVKKHLGVFVDKQQAGLAYKEAKNQICAKLGVL